MFKEHEDWLDLCEQLVGSGAVTGWDMDQPQTAEGTPGLALIKAIRDWGESLGKLRVNHCLDVAVEATRSLRQVR